MITKRELRKAIGAGNLQDFCRSFELSDLDSNDYGGSLLHNAASRGTLEIVKFLVDSGAEVIGQAELTVLALSRTLPPKASSALCDSSSRQDPT